MEIAPDGSNQRQYNGKNFLWKEKKNSRLD